MLVLQSEWQALYDKTGEDTDGMLEVVSVQEEDLGGDMGDVDGMDESDGNADNQEDAEGFRAVLSRRGRKKQGVNKADTVVEE